MFNRNKEQEDYSDDLNQQVREVMLAEEISGRSWPMPPSQNDESIGKWELDTEREIRKVELTFLGFEKTSEGYQKVSDPIINQKGLYSLLAPIKALGNKITSLTILTEEDIRRDCMAFRKAIALMVITNRRRWDIKKSNRSPIILTLDTLLNSILNKSKNALIVRARREQVQVKEIRAEGLPNKNRQFPKV